MTLYICTLFYFTCNVLL